ANDAGTGSPLTICGDDSTDYNLRDYLTGEDDGGTWTGPDGASDGMFMAGTDTAGTYTYTVDADGDGPCPADSEDVVVTLIPLPETPDTQIIQADCQPGSKGSVALSYLDPDITQFYYRYKLDEAGDDTWSIWTLYTGAIALGQADYDFEVKYTEDGCVSEDFPITIDRPLDVVLTLEPSVTPVICETGLGSIEILNAAVLGLDKMNYTVFNQANPGVPLASYDYVKYPAGGFSLAPGIYLITAVSNNGCEFGSTIQTLVEPICQEFEGCTLGYWKNHTDRWECYSTCTLYSEVFGGEGVTVPSALQGKTLLEVLNLGGGGVYNLGRQSVAALLNTCHSDVNYEIGSTEALIAYVNASLKNNPGEAGSILDAFNNAGCTLGGTRATTDPFPLNICGAPEVSKPGKGNGKKSALTSGFKASPVPFKDKLSIQYDFDYVSDVNIQVYDLRGQLLKTYKDKKVTKGDVKDLGIDFRMKANQIYILRVQTNREVFTQNIISAKR
ncbi:T9SS type A sorting domain-containing protein, partial [Christiangramia aquimixticola]|uniref:T9SS type A sorting domain-containing protein n=1 Tax=Christiangramia aquimixticola TaxID=1697558 RepID=UPI003AA8313E